MYMHVYRCKYLYHQIFSPSPLLNLFPYSCHMMTLGPTWKSPRADLQKSLEKLQKS